MSSSAFDLLPRVAQKRLLLEEMLHHTVLKNSWIKQRPTARQVDALILDDVQEVFYGGAAGGGKSSWLLMEALKYVSVPKYAGILFRKTLTDLSLPGALMDRAQEWLGGSEALWSDKSKTWEFPSGATLTFAYLDNVRDHYRYKSAEFQFVGFDELTQFPENQYTYLFSRLRRLKGSKVPIRMRSASNPGDQGHEWVKERFVSCQATERKRFVSALLDDNPHLDREEYVASLQNLDPVTRAQLLAGDWDAYEGGRFRREWFRRFYVGENTYDLYRREGERWVLHHSWPKQHCWHFGTCDPAASDKESADYTAAGAWAVSPKNDLMLLEVVRKHLAVEDIVPTLKELCQRHSLRFMAIEDVAFQAMILAEARRTVGMPPIRGVDPAGKDKLVRATPAILRAEGGQFYLPERAAWLDAYTSELVQFTGNEDKDPYDDQVDMTAYAALEIDRMGLGKYSEGTEEESTRLKPTHESKQARRGLFGLSRRENSY